MSKSLTAPRPIRAITKTVPKARRVSTGWMNVINPNRNKRAQSERIRRVMFRTLVMGTMMGLPPR